MCIEPGLLLYSSRSTGIRQQKTQTIITGQDNFILAVPLAHNPASKDEVR